MIPGPENSASQCSSSDEHVRWSFSLRSLVVSLTIVILLAGWGTATVRLRTAETELAVLRSQIGYLQPSGVGQIAAVRIESDQPLTYRLRVRVPDSAKFRVAYSTFWSAKQPSPDWYSAVDLPPGESRLTVQIREDPRDERWKITTMVQGDRGTKRMATVLPDDHVRRFRQPNDVFRSGIGRETEFAAIDQSIRLLDERWLVGEDGLLLYGNRQPENDIVGVFAELQPDIGPL